MSDVKTGPSDRREVASRPGDVELPRAASSAECASMPEDKTFCEFFAGIGLVHEALSRSGWRCVYANDIDAKKAAMYRGRFGPSEHLHVEDVWKTDSVLSRVDGRIDLATASFPCTNMSLAGRREGFDGAESSAFFGFVEVLRRLEDRPALLMLENVVGFLTAHGGADFRAAVEALADLGYWLDAMVVDARRFVPQSRPRLFLFGFHERQSDEGLIRQGSDFLGDPWAREVASSAELRPERLRRAMEAIALPTGWAVRRMPALPVRVQTLSEVLDLDESQDWWDSLQVERHYSMMSAAHRREIDVWRAGAELHVATIFRRIRGGQQRAEVRMDGLAGCLRTPRGGSARQIVVVAGGGKLKMRWMSPREYARLQGAGDFPWEVSDSQALFGFGDGVCVPVICWLDEHLLGPSLQSR